eukprot:1158136-Pelagomonas_calceolata.AAC.7
MITTGVSKEVEGKPLQTAVLGLMLRAGNQGWKAGERNCCLLGGSKLGGEVLPGVLARKQAVQAALQHHPVETAKFCTMAVSRWCWQMLAKLQSWLMRMAAFLT